MAQAGASSGQDSSNENQANYNQAQVKQGESASDVKNPSSLQRPNHGGQTAGQIDAPAGGAAHRLQEVAAQAQQHQWMNSIMNACLSQNQITNKDLFDNLKRFTQQSAITARDNSKSHVTLPTKATGED
jgi:hypothetical protein